MNTSYSNQDGIVRLELPIPVPELYSLPRWKVFLSLFNRRMSFHTCKSLRVQLHKETCNLANLYVDKVKCWSPKIELHPDFGDAESMLNMRNWLEGCVEAKGAKVAGGGMGMGEADIDIELEGFRYNINIKPL